MFRGYRSYFVCTLLFILGACGGTTPPPAPAPSNPGAQGPVGLGGNLEDPCPGTPLGQLQNSQDVWQAMNANLNGLGFASVQNQAVVDYLVQIRYQSPTQFQHIPNQNPPPQQQVPSYQLDVTTDYIQLSQNYGGRHTFTYVDRIRDYGLNLMSTDQVALYTSSQGGSLHILKVLFRQHNPPMQWFEVQDISMGGNRGSYQLRVYSKMLGTTLQNNYGNQNPGMVPGQGQSR